LLGALFAAIAAFTYALNNATMRRGVLTGTVMQGMAITVPVGALGFLALAVISGNIPQLLSFPPRAAAFMATQGVIHFLVGRYFNYRANQLVGVNLSAPVVQLQVVVAMFLAVLILHEPFTVLQTIGSVLMLAGSFATQRHSAKPKAAKPVAAQGPSLDETARLPAFRPRYFAGYVCSATAAIAYGMSPMLIRLAFDSAEHHSTVAGAAIAYTAAAAVFSLSLLSQAVRWDLAGLKRDNGFWFLVAAVLVTVSQGFVYASLAVAPLMVVTPILQLSLVFRLILSRLINPGYEVFNVSVIVGAAAAVVGSILVSLSTDFAVAALALPDGVGQALRLRLAGG
jgi:drug/metabolite transporter (DMT)-like permease